MKYFAMCLLFVAASVTAAAQSAFRDDFNGPALDPAWTVITYTGPFPRIYGYTTPTNTMSLNARPGHLRYSLEPMTYESGFINSYRTTQPGETSCCSMDPALELQRKFTGEHWLLETRLDSYMPYTNGRGFRLQVYFGNGGPGTYVVPLWRQRDVNQNWHGVLFLEQTGTRLADVVRIRPDAYADLPLYDGPNSSAWFRLRRDGGMLTASISFDGSTWSVLESVDLGTALNGLEQRLSLTGGSWFNTAGSYADWDYVSLQPTGTPPSITCPGDIVANADSGSCGTNVAFDVAAAGSPAPALTCNRVSNGFFPVGTTAVTCTASNGIAPDASCTFHVTVTDRERPTISALPDIEATADSSCSPLAVNAGIPTAHDNCGSPSLVPTRSDDQRFNAPFPIGTTIVTWHARDTSGNTATSQQTITIKPAPFVMSAVTASPASLWPPNRAMVDVALQYLASGGCGTASCSITSIASNQPGRGDPTSPDWEVIDPHHVKLRAESIGHDWRVYTITLQCRDGNGQSQTRTVRVAVGK